MFLSSPYVLGSDLRQPSLIITPLLSFCDHEAKKQYINATLGERNWCYEREGPYNCNNTVCNALREPGGHIPNHYVFVHETKVGNGALMSRLMKD